MTDQEKIDSLEKQNSLLKKQVELLEQINELIKENDRLKIYPIYQPGIIPVPNYPNYKEFEFTWGRDTTASPPLEYPKIFSTSF